jgi:hypothetical protein
MIPARRAQLIFALAIWAAASLPLAAPGRVPVGERGVGVTQAQEPSLYYRTSWCVVDLAPGDLAKTYPFLKDVELAPNQEELPSILRTAGDNVAAFFRTFSNTSSSEDIERTVIATGSRRSGETHSRYLYLMLARSGNEMNGLEEYRTDLKGRPLDPKDLERGGLLTSGFAAHSVYFHRDFQSGSRFRLIGRTRKQPTLVVVAFAEDPDVSRTPIAVTTESGESRLWVQGFAWIDAQSGQVTRMRTELYAAKADAGLQEQTTEIWFHEVKPGNHPVWLLREVKVRLKRAGWTYENTHRYSDYHSFSVETREERKTPTERPKPPE